MFHHQQQQNGNGHGATIVLPAAVLAHVAERLDERTDRPNPTACHLFRGRPHPSGWVRMAVGAKTWSAARLAYLVAYGSLPLNARVFHACGTANCLNANHLTLTNPRRRPPRPPAPPRTKLSPARVRSLRRAYRDGLLRMTQAARQLGVNVSCISRAARGLTYPAVGA